MKHLTAFLLSSLVCASALADVTALLVTEPTNRKDVLMVSRDALQAHLSRVLKETVVVTTSDDLTDAMRATRSGGYDVFIAPPQVAASALGHGYALVGVTDADEQYLLVGRTELPSVAALRGKQIYLPQQDSIYTYLARGLLNANGLSFKDMKGVDYERYPQAGLFALMLGHSEATMVRSADWEEWDRGHAGIAKVLAVSSAVPGGYSVAVRKKLPPETRGKLAHWFETDATTCGLKPVYAHPDLSPYTRVAELGTFTPKALPGATVVDHDTVKTLVGAGAVLVDTRIESEYKDKHIPGALWLPYGEKSLKDVAFDARLDSFPGLARLDRERDIVFQCNGPECWKSYKASRAAIAAGYKHVYWFRGGMPEWETAGERTEKSGQTLALSN
ncbi:MAG TPA: rhodanese-like domain-containing protein [Burkholderiaceae bacterium]|nr:rhodanese-like domain-containing protein [Burkholderiaceae bacterium]